MAKRESSSKDLGTRNNQEVELTRSEAQSELLRELVAHLRQNRTQLREEWARRITRAELLTAMTEEEIFAEATAVYDNYVEALETGTFEALQAYSRRLSERIIPRGVETDEVVGIVLLLRDVLARSLFTKYQDNVDKLNRILDSYEPAANRIANTVAVGFVEERERIIRQQQEAIRELSTPVLQVRERLLILPIIGVIDPQRARQLTEQLLRAIRANRAKVVVIDVTGVAAMDSGVANHLVQTVEASRLLGATVIVTGLSPEIAQTLVTIGVDLSEMATVGDLQGGIEEAERLLADRAIPSPARETSAENQRLLAPPAAGGLGGSTNIAAGAIPHRLDSVRSNRRRPLAPARSVDRAGGPIPLPRRDRGRHRVGRHGLVRRGHPPRHRAHGPAARRRNGDRRYSAGRGVRHGPARLDPQGRRYRTRPRRRAGVPQPAGRRAPARDEAQEI